MIKFLKKYKHQLLSFLAHISMLIMFLVLPLWLWIAGLILGWISANLSHSLYIHRIYSHKQFNVYQWVHIVGLFLFSGLSFGSPIVYAAVHLNHHKYSGKSGDPHDPNQLGWFRTLFSIWNKDFRPDRRFYARAIKKGGVPVHFHKHNFRYSLAFAILFPFLPVLGFWLSKIVIWLVHIPGIGYTAKINNNELPDTSQNVPWLKLLCWGEELHNNHHNYASRGNHNIKNKWYEFDGLYYIGKILEKT